MIAYTGTCYRYRYFLFQGWTGKAINSIGRGMSARSGIGWSHRVIPRIGKLAIVVTTRHFQQPRNMAESATASQTELKSSKTPIGWRDQCSAYVALSLSQLLLLWLTSSSPKKYIQLDSSSLLIPLNVCRREKSCMPWECNDQRHADEKYVAQVFVFVST